MKWFSLLWIFLAIALINACASRSEVMTEQSSSQSATVVPGEKIPGEGMTPGTGPGGASANVRW